MFYCREEELSVLNKRYEKGRFECIIIYGRRRVGKTALINEFCRGKPTVYFSALNAASLENLEALSKAIYLFKNPDGIHAPSYQSYADALDEITRMAENTHLVFVIDEYPYLAKAEKSISSRLQCTILSFLPSQAEPPAPMKFPQRLAWSPVSVQSTCGCCWSWAF